MDDKLRDVRKKLRLAMNGIISSSMRQKGMEYKLIFGVPLPEIRQISGSIEADADFARTLWREDVREMKILATMIFPSDMMTVNEALQWVAEIKYLEIAEQCCNNLFPFIPESDKLATLLLSDLKSLYGRVSGFLLFAQLFKRNIFVSSGAEDKFLSECVCSVYPTKERKISIVEKQAVLQALKFYGRDSVEKARKALNALDCPEKEMGAEQKEMLNDLKFEYDYYSKS